MRSLGGQAPQQAAQPAPRPQWHRCVALSRQQCFTGHSTATAFAAQPAVADAAVIRHEERLEGSAARQAAQSVQAATDGAWCAAGSCRAPPPNVLRQRDRRVPVPASAVTPEPQAPVVVQQQLLHHALQQQQQQQQQQPTHQHHHHHQEQQHQQEDPPVPECVLLGCASGVEQLQQQAAADLAGSLEYQKDICRSLRAENCCSVEQLAAILSEHGPHMDGQAVAASFTAAARLGKQLLQLQHSQQQQQQQQQQQELLRAGAAASSAQQASYQLVQLLEQQLLPLLQPKLRQLDAVGLQMVLYSLASLQYKQEVLVLQLEVAITPILHHLPPGRLCQLVWSLGQLSLQPNGQLVKSLLRCSSRCMSFLQGQDLCQLLQGLVQLQLQPHVLWLDACCARVLQLCAHQRLQPRALCSILHNLACVVCNQQPPQQQQQQNQQQHPPLQQQGQGVPRTAAGLPQPLLQQLLAATQQVLEDAAGSAHQPTPAAGGLHLLQGTPQHTLQQHQQQQHLQRQPARHPKQPQQQQQQLTSAGLVMLADSLRRLKADPPKVWVAAYVAAAGQLMHSSDARNLPLMLAPCVRWRLPPGADWLQRYLAACEGLLPAMHRQGLAVLGHSLTALQVQPSAGWLRAYLAAADSTRVAATPAGCSYLMQTLGAWMQLGCLRPEQQQQPAAAGAVLQAAGAGRAGSSPVHALCAGAGGSGAGAGHSRREHLGAAAPGEQLQPMAHALAAQCIRCFMDQGHLFTAEQLGVFCKGLAQWGMQGTPQLAERFEQVVLQQLSQQPRARRRRTAQQQQRPTAATLCSVLLALAVACPDAATPALLSVLWTAWSSWLLPMTTPAHAAGAAWAMGRLGVQPPQGLAQGLLQQLVMAAGDAQLQHLAAVLLEAKRGGWQVQQQQVSMLAAVVLEKQAAELLAARQTAGVCGEGRRQCDCVAAATAATAQQPLAQHGGLGVGGNGSSSSGAADRLYYGLANHRLKHWASAGAAVAAWCDLLPLQQLRSAVHLYSSCMEVLSVAEERGAVEAHLLVMRAACAARMRSDSDSDS